MLFPVTIFYSIICSTSRILIWGMLWLTYYVQKYMMWLTYYVQKYMMWLRGYVQKYHYLVFHRECYGTAQTVQISEMGRDIIRQKGDGASHHHSGENNTDPMWRMPSASNTQVRERNCIISKTKKLFQRLTYWMATSFPEHFNVDHSCDAGVPGTQWTVRILYSHCQNAEMQSEHNQGSSILASLRFIELHVTQDHFVKPS